MTTIELNTDICECCESKNVSIDLIETKFEYNNSGKIVELETCLPVVSCSDCGIEYTCEEAEDLKIQAIRKFLGLLSPDEIIAIRTTYGFSKKEFCEITDIGTASLSRWETGKNFQSKANDNYLRLISRRENLSLIQNREVTENFGEPVFLALGAVSPALMQRSQRFIP